MDNLIINFLGQAGFKIDINNTSILIDPYLSNSVSAVPLALLFSKHQAF